MSHVWFDFCFAVQYWFILISLCIDNPTNKYVWLKTKKVCMTIVVLPSFEIDFEKGVGEIDFETMLVFIYLSSPIM